jgi:hypothetical protein
MRIYVVTTGLIFGLLTAVHLWRIVEEPHLVREPWFLSFTVLSAILCIASFVVIRRQSSAS